MAKQLSKAKLYIGQTTPPPGTPGADVFDFVGNIYGLDGPELTKGQIEHTDFDSTAKEYFGDLKDQGTMSGTMRRNFGSVGQNRLRANANAAGGTQYWFKVEEIAASGAVLETLTFVGEVVRFAPARRQGAPHDVNIEIRISGDVGVT